MRHKRQKWHLIILIMGVLIYVGYIMFDQHKILAFKYSEIKRVQAQIEEQKRIAENLKQQREKLNSDSYVEEVARTKIGMVKPGEIVFIDINK